MSKKIYLNGGADLMKNESLEIDRKFISETDNKRICVLDLTTNDDSKKVPWRDFLKQYFRQLGSKETFFASTSKDIKSQLNSSGIVYLPGGDPAILMENIKNNELEDSLKNFKGILVGNSAGAMVLSNEGVCMGYKGEEDRIKGLGLVNFAVDVHYDKTQDEQLKSLSLSKDLYAIPETSVIIVEDNKKSFIGNVYKFSKGNKIKIN